MRRTIVIRMSEIVYRGGPRDGDRESGEWQPGQQVLTLGAGDVGAASSVSAESGAAIEMPWHVYVVVEREYSFVAEYLGLYGARELPRS